MLSTKRETLAQRLERGPMSGREATRLCRLLLAVLEAEHAHGMAHGAITPHTIVLDRDRPVLAGFRSASIGDTRWDLHALAAVVYQAASGRPWTAMMTPATADWSGIPRRLRYALRKALAVDSRDRFPDAAAFQRALWVPRPQPLVWPAVVVLAFAAALISVIVLCRPLGLCPERSYELMIVPFDVPEDTTRLGTELAALVAHRLQQFRGFAVVPGSVAVRFWEDSLAGQRPHRLRVAARAGGSIVAGNSGLVVNLDVRDSLGRPLQRAAVHGPREPETVLADSIVLQLLRWFHPELMPSTQVRRVALSRCSAELARRAEV